MAPPTISDDAAAAGQRSRSRRAPTKSRKPDEPVAEDPRATARARPYPEPKSHKATSSKKHAKGSADRKTSSAKGKKTQAKAQESEEEDAEGEDAGIEEEEQGQGVTANPRMDPPAARPAPLAPRSYYPPSAHPQNYEITDSPPAQKTEEIHPQPQYQPYHEEPPRPNRPTGSLASLADGPEGPEGRPPYPYSTLIRYAIEGSERGKLTLSELYSHIEARFPWFGKNGAGWKNSIRHNLSLNKSFVKIPRPLTEPGKGSYWCINYNVADGENVGDGAGAEPAKRKRNKRKEDVSAQAHPVVDSVSTDSGAPPPAPSVYENPYPTSGYGGQPVAQGYPYAPQQPYPSPHVQQHHTGGEAQEDEEYDEEDAAGEQEATAPYQDQNAAYYAQQQYAYPHPAAQQPAPPMQHSAPVEAVYPNPNAPQTVYYSQHPAVPYTQQYPVQVNPTQVPPQPPPQAGFVDDRPDRTAPRTIYNHAGGPPGGSYGSAAQTTTPLGALATSVPHVNMNPAHPHMYGAPYAYGQYPPAHVSQSPQGYTSSLGGAMGPPPGQT